MRRRQASPFFASLCAALILGGIPASALADTDEQGGPGGPGAPGDSGGSVVEVEHKFSGYAAAAVSSQATGIGLVRHHLGIGVPVWTRESDEVTVNLAVAETRLSGRLLLPDTRRTLSDKLWNLSVGIQYLRHYPNGSYSMLMADLESPSDRPFHTSRERGFSLGGIHQKRTRGGRDAWLLGIIYTPAGSPSFPIPLVAYDWNPSERWRVGIGLPISLTWQPTRRLGVEATYLFDSSARATWTLSCRTAISAGYETVSDQFLLSDRTNDDDRLFDIEKRWFAGIRRAIWRTLMLDLNAGYAFDRHFGEGENESGLHDRVSFESRTFVGLKLEAGF